MCITNMFTVILEFVQCVLKTMFTVYAKKISVYFNFLTYIRTEKNYTGKKKGKIENKRNKRNKKHKSLLRTISYRP